MFKPFNQFTKEIYDAHSDGMKKIYGSEAKHRVSYLANKGFGDWIDSFRGETLNLRQTKSLAETYHKLGKRSTEDVVSSMVHIARQYDVQFPVVEGILSKDYWDKHFSTDAEMAP